MAYISQTSIGPISTNVETTNIIIRKVQVKNTGSLQIQSNGGSLRIISPTSSSVQGMIISSGQVQILGS